MHLRVTPLMEKQTRLSSGKAVLVPLLQRGRGDGGVARSYSLSPKSIVRISQFVNQVIICVGNRKVICRLLISYNVVAMVVIVDSTHLSDVTISPKYISMTV